MSKRADRIGRIKPWRVLSAPVPRDWDLILSEVNSELGVELFVLARQLRMFADCPVDSRAKLFAGTAGRHVAERRTEALHEATAALRPSLLELMRVTSSRAPKAAVLATACEAVAMWAQESGFRDTAIHFAESAAVLCSNDPHFSFIAGRTNRLFGIAWRAELFYSRAIRLAYRDQNWSLYVRARLGLGRLNVDRGRLRSAARHYFSAARVAIDQGHDWLAAQTYHDIFPLYFELGEIHKAHVFARKALSTYPRHHERFPVAVHDYLLLLIFQRHYREAWPLLERLAHSPLRPHDQVLIWGTIGRVAGNLQIAARYADAEARVLELAPHWDTFAPAAYLGLAAGAHALKDGALAKIYADRALSLAHARQDRQALRLTRELMTELASGHPAPPPTPLEGVLAEGLQALTPVVVEEVASWRSDSTWTARETQSGLWRLGPV